MEANGWKGIIAQNLEAANVKFQKECKGREVSLVVLELHGTYKTVETKEGKSQSYGQIITNNHADFADPARVVTRYDLDGQVCRNIDGAEALVNMVSSVKKRGNFLLKSCDTARDDQFFYALANLTENKVNIWGVETLCNNTYAPGNRPSVSIIDPAYTVTKVLKENTAGGIKLYKAGTQFEAPELFKNLIIGVKSLIPIK